MVKIPKLTEKQKAHLKRINENLHKWHDAMKILDNIEKKNNIFGWKGFRV